MKTGTWSADHLGRAFGLMAATALVGALVAVGVTWALVVLGALPHGGSLGIIIGFLIGSAGPAVGFAAGHVIVARIDARRKP